MENSALSPLMMLVGGMTATDAQPATPATPEPPSITAAQALRAHGRMTSIGPDPCRRRTGDEIANDEIVVCARRTNPYEVPLYSAPAERYDDPFTTVGGAIAMKRANAPCHARGEACLEPLVIYSTGPVRRPPVRVGED